jgi:hypothetical protein
VATETYPSSTWPLQLSSIPLHVVSDGAGVPGVHEFWTVPPTQDVTPVEAHAPTPQLVGCETYPSSTWPLQLSSIPLQVVSEGAGVPGVQESWTVPDTHEVTPVAWHAPTPQLVGCETYPSSTWPLQLSSIPLQVVSDAAGVPGVHESWTVPDTHEVTPVAWHAPTPQLVGCETYPSSTWPLQLSSIPLHVVSDGAGVPGVHEFWTVPPTHDVTPVEAQAPMPQLVGCETYPSSTWPLQLSSIPLHVVSAAPGWTAALLSSQSPAVATYPLGCVQPEAVTLGLP